MLLVHDLRSENPFYGLKRLILICSYKGIDCFLNTDRFNILWAFSMFCTLFSSCFQSRFDLLGGDDFFFSSENELVWTQVFSRWNRWFFKKPCYVCTWLQSYGRYSFYFDCVYFESLGSYPFPTVAYAVYLWPNQAVTYLLCTCRESEIQYMPHIYVTATEST